MEEPYSMLPISQFLAFMLLYFKYMEETTA